MLTAQLFFQSYVLVVSLLGYVFWEVRNSEHPYAARRRGCETRIVFLIVRLCVPYFEIRRDLIFVCCRSILPGIP